jgi:hypothetical protein
VRVIVINHINDPVIPKEARMAECVRNYPSKHVALISSLRSEHASVTDDIKNQLIWLLSKKEEA